VIDILVGVVVFVGGLGLGIYLASSSKRDKAYRKAHERFEKQRQRVEDSMEQMRNKMTGGPR